jgi:hypothetical protein
LPVQAYADLEHMETPYVVKLHRFTPLAPTQPVFSFEHPNRSPSPIDNSRSADLDFERPGAPAALCHGFAGYFDACLCAPYFGNFTSHSFPVTVLCMHAPSQTRCLA